jgi:DNA-directed RNA polymerase subunit M/transcription elongation factor TFIIS
MAVYGRECRHCGTLMRPTTTTIRGITDVPVWKCPKCRSYETSAVSIVVYENALIGEVCSYDEYAHMHYRELMPNPTWVIKTTQYEVDYEIVTVC